VEEKAAGEFYSGMCDRVVVPGDAGRGGWGGNGGKASRRLVSSLSLLCFLLLDLFGIAVALRFLSRVDEFGLAWRTSVYLMCRSIMVQVQQLEFD
jgi:hypothetical protein